MSDKTAVKTYTHAVIWTDHNTAQVLHFDDDSVQAQKVHAHVHPTGQHGSGVRAEHEFFGHVCDAVEGVASVLVTGSHTATADFRHYADKHRPKTAQRVAAYEVVDHPTGNQLVAHARKFFVAYERMHGAPGAH